jgi:microcystin-dependent protein
MLDNHTHPIPGESDHGHTIHGATDNTMQPYAVVAYIIKALEGAPTISGIGTDTLPIGTITPFGGPASGAPTGFLACDGREVSRTTYDTLFAALSNGAIWGIGNGTTTFNLPDLRAKSPLGLNDGTLPGGADGGYTTRNMGDVGGEENHTLTTAELASHTHQDDTRRNDPGSLWGQASGISRCPEVGVQNLGASSAGGDNPHNTMHPFAVVGYLIKAQQVGGGLGVTAQDNGGPLQGPQPTLNFIPAGGTSFGVANDALNNRVDVTITTPAAPAANHYVVLDSTSTFAAINAALASGANNIVYLKPGNYLHPHSPITVPAGKQLIGLTGPMGDEPAELPTINPVLKPTSTGVSLITVVGDATVKNLWITGSNGGPATATDYAIEQSNNAEPIWLENIFVNAWGQSGGVNAPGYSVGRGRFIHCTAAGGQWSGFLCGDPGDPNQHATIFEGCVAHNNSTSGFDVVAGNGQLFLHCKSWQNGANGYEVGSSVTNRLKFLRCHAEGNSGHGWNWFATNTNLGCAIEHCAAAGHGSGWGFTLSVPLGTNRAVIHGCVGLLNGLGDFSVSGGWAQSNNVSAA